MNITEYLTAEQDKWHRRYNDAEIEIDRLKRENESYKLAIHRLIMERDMAIKDMYGVEDSVLYACQECAKRPCGRIRECKGFVWRGVRKASGEKPSGRKESYLYGDRPEDDNQRHIRVCVHFRGVREKAKMRKKKMTDIDRIEWMDKYEGLLTIDQFADELKTSPRNIRKLRKESSQICWTCKNACNGNNCSWVRYHIYPSYVTIAEDGHIIGCERYEE